LPIPIPKLAPTWMLPSTLAGAPWQDKRLRSQKKGPSLRDPFLFGSGGVICAVPIVAQRIRLK
jgi:hypothetical protein